MIRRNEKLGRLNDSCPWVCALPLCSQCYNLKCTPFNFMIRDFNSCCCKTKFVKQNPVVFFFLRTINGEFYLTKHKTSQTLYPQTLMIETNLQKRGLVHRVPCIKSREKLQKFFQRVCLLFCKYKHCIVF